MPGKSLIGALNVTLGLDSGQFQAGLKKAQSSLSGVSRTMAAVSKSAAAAFSGFAVGAVSAISLSAAIGQAKQALDEFGNIAGRRLSTEP